MKLNAKDIKDLEGVIYWGAAVKADLQAINTNKLPAKYAEYLDTALKHLEAADSCACRILTGENRCR